MLVTRLDIFMRALPFTFWGAEAEPDSIVTVAVTGEAGGKWRVERKRDRWEADRRTASASSGNDHGR